jgi:hypothetical protein
LQWERRSQRGGREQEEGERKVNCVCGARANCGQTARRRPAHLDRARPHGVDGLAKQRAICQGCPEGSLLCWHTHAGHLGDPLHRLPALKAHALLTNELLVGWRAALAEGEGTLLQQQFQVRQRRRPSATGCNPQLPANHPPLLWLLLRLPHAMLLLLSLPLQHTQLHAAAGRGMRSLTTQRSPCYSGPRPRCCGALGPSGWERWTSCFDAVNVELPHDDRNFLFQTPTFFPRGCSSSPARLHNCEHGADGAKLEVLVDCAMQRDGGGEVSSSWTWCQLQRNHAAAPRLDPPGGSRWLHAS